MLPKGAYTFLGTPNDPWHSGYITFLSVGANIDCDGNIYCGGDISCPGNVFFTGTTTTSNIDCNGNIDCGNYAIECLYMNPKGGWSGTVLGTSVLGTSAAPWTNGNIFYLSVGGNVVHGSDDRLKHNEVDIVNGLDLIRQLVPQFYQKTQDLKDADYIGDLSDGTWKWESGFIAQEVLQIADLSYCVEGGDYIDESGNTVAAPHTLNYNNIFTYACAGLKELDQIVQTEITFLKQENVDLSNNVNLLQQENASMKTALNELLAAAGKSTI